MRVSACSFLPAGVHACVSVTGATTCWLRRRAGWWRHCAWLRPWPGL